MSQDLEALKKLAQATRDEAMRIDRENQALKKEAALKEAATDKMAAIIASQNQLIEKQAAEIADRKRSEECRKIAREMVQLGIAAADEEDGVVEKLAATGELEVTKRALEMYRPGGSSLLKVAEDQSLTDLKPSTVAQAADVFNAAMLGM